MDVRYLRTTKMTSELTQRIADLQDRIIFEFSIH